MEYIQLSRIIIFSIIAVFLSFGFAPILIRFLTGLKLEKQIRDEASLGGGKAKQFQKLHKHKKGTPTMGGVLIIFIVFIMVVLSVIVLHFGQYIGIDVNFSLWNRKETYLVLFTLFTIGILGAIDDYMNIRGIGKTKGMSARVKMLGLSVFAAAGAWWFWSKLGFNSVNIPFLGSVEIGAYYIPLFIFIILAMTNAVNITDGLDGLLGGLMIQNFALYAFITFDKELFLLATVCGIILACLLGFLWFNIKPAKFYMGDTGSLALGATLGVMAMMTDTLIVLFIVSGIYIWEIISVIIQVTSKKLRKGKKVFKIAPYHHHLEANGWAEETIVMRFWMIGSLLSSIGAIIYILIR